MKRAKRARMMAKELREATAVLGENVFTMLWNLSRLECDVLLARARSGGCRKLTDCLPYVPIQRSREEKGTNVDIVSNT